MGIYHMYPLKRESRRAMIAGGHPSKATNEFINCIPTDPNVWLGFKGIPVFI
jgi:hypothetical protein